MNIIFAVYVFSFVILDNIIKTKNVLCQKAPKNSFYSISWSIWREVIMRSANDWRHSSDVLAVFMNTLPHVRWSNSPKAEALTGSDAVLQALLHVLCDLPHHAGVCRHVGQLQTLEAQRERQVAQSEAVVVRCIGVVDGWHILSQDDQDDWEEQRQSDLHQSDQDLTLLQSKRKRSGLDSLICMYGRW